MDNSFLSGRDANEARDLEERADKTELFEFTKLGGRVPGQEKPSAPGAAPSDSTFIGSYEDFEKNIVEPAVGKIDSSSK